MVNREQIEIHLKKLEEYIKELENLKKTSLQKFLKDKGLQDRVERNLHLVIESSLDIGNQVISEQGFRLPDTYGDIFVILAENKVISEEFASDLEKMAGFRNILVHDYLKIDKEKVYGNLEKLDDLKDFAKAVVLFIEG